MYRLGNIMIPQEELSLGKVIKEKNTNARNSIGIFAT